MKSFVSFFCLSMVLLTGKLNASTATISAGKQYAFALQLQQQGDAVFSLLEFKRFLFLYPQDARAPDARFQMANIYLDYVGDLNACRTELQRIVKDYPRSRQAGKSRDLLNFIEINSDFNGKPLLAWMKAQNAEQQKQYPRAVSRYQELARTFPRAKLADDAFYRAGILTQERLKKPEEANRLFTTLIQLFPQSPLAADAAYRQAVILEAGGGAPKAVTNAYSRVIQQYPKSSAATQAAKQLAVRQKKEQMIARSFDKRFVQPYKEVNKMENPARRQISILVDAGLSEREVKATLEDALIANIPARRSLKQALKITAYYKYPTLKAGSVNWSPKQKIPTYRMHKIKAKDVAKDLFIDLLKKY